MHVSTYHQQLTAKLSEQGNPTAALDARLLICHFLQLDFTQFLLQQNRPISSQEANQLQAAEQKALAHMPISRILESREFWGLEFAINADVLDPRADSEILIETILHFVPTLQAKLHFLDLGTGTGCLLLSLLSEYQNATGIGADFSPNALKVASQNAINLNLSERVTLIQSDWFHNIDAQKFDVILSNPPYIPDADIDNLADNVKLYDPISALAGGDDGLDPYRIITAQAAQYLTSNGILIFEMGHNQAPALFDILAENGFTSESFTMPQTNVGNQNTRNGLGFDLGQNPRIIISKLN